MENIDTKLAELLADFNAKNNEIKNQISSLDKSLNSVKQTVLERFEEVKAKMIEDGSKAWELIKDLRWNEHQHDDYVRTEIHTYYSNSLTSGESCDNGFYLYFEKNGSGYYNFLVQASYALYIKSSSDEREKIRFYATKEYVALRQNYIKYFEDSFYSDLIEIVVKIFDIEYQYNLKVLEERKNAFANIESISKSSNSHWSDYLMYLLKWSSEHTDEKLYGGQSPACYDEWYNNEYESEE